MKTLILAGLVAATLSLVSACAGSGSSVRTHYGVGVGYYGYGYRPWGPCRFGCVPPDIDRPRPELPIEPTPELPIESPIFEATPLPEMDFDMDFGEW